MESCAAIAGVLKGEEKKNLLLAAVRSLYADKSWRVRYVVAEKFVKLAEALGKEIIASDLIAAFVSILKDSEAEVRTIACAAVPGKPL